MNMLNYALKAKQSFSESPFNYADALILCWISYFRYPDYLKKSAGVAVKDIEKYGLLPYKQMYGGAFSPKKSEKLFGCLVKSKRFQNVKLSCYSEENDEFTEKQFGAICIEIAENEYFISFRGTDPSFVGWKEDFNLVCRYPVPSQTEALSYIRRIMSVFPNGRFYTGGHSKGGNVAVYAAAKAEKSMQDRILSVYNFDGPSFKYNIFNENGFKNICGKIVKIVPQASFVGMLFETGNSFEIIKSGTVGFLQHDPFSWKIRCGGFVNATRRTVTSVKIERVFNLWLNELSDGEAERLTALVYEALNTLNVKDFNEFFKKLFICLPALYRRYRRLDASDRMFFNSKTKRLKELLTGKRAKT